MRIAIDARSLEGNKTGVGRFLENLLKFWGTDKSVEFVLYFQKSIPKEDFLKSENFKVKVIGNLFGFYSNFVFQHFLLPLHLKKNKVDFFFSPFYLRPIFCPVRSGVVLHDISYEAHPEWFDSRSQFVLRFLSRISAKKADVIFTVSESSKNEIIKLYAINSEKIVVAHLAPDKDLATGISDLNVLEFKKKYNLDKFVLCVGSMFTRRHIPDLISAFVEFCRYRQDLKLFIVGKDCTYPFANIESKIAEANSMCLDRIVHVDFLEEGDLKSAYASSDLIVYLSDYEGFGLPVVEAQLFQKPVITSYNTSLIEVGGESVEFVSDNKSEQILLALKNVILNDDRKEYLENMSRENLKRFDWQKTAEKILGRIKDFK